MTSNLEYKQYLKKNFLKTSGKFLDHVKSCSQSIMRIINYILTTMIPSLAIQKQKKNMRNIMHSGIFMQIYDWYLQNGALYVYVAKCQIDNKVTVIIINWIKLTEYTKRTVFKFDNMQSLFHLNKRGCVCSLLSRVKCPFFSIVSVIWI